MGIIITTRGDAIVLFYFIFSLSDLTSKINNDNMGHHPLRAMSCVFLFIYLFIIKKFLSHLKI
jgi:hypothetical protein